MEFDVLSTNSPTCSRRQALTKLTKQLGPAAADQPAPSQPTWDSIQLPRSNSPLCQAASPGPCPAGLRSSWPAMAARGSSFSPAGRQAGGRQVVEGLMDGDGARGYRSANSQGNRGQSAGYPITQPPANVQRYCPHTLTPPHPSPPHPTTHTHAHTRTHINTHLPRGSSPRHAPPGRLWAAAPAAPRCARACMPASAARRPPPPGRPPRCGGSRR